MKKLILFAAILFAGVSVVKAQHGDGQGVTGKNTTTLKVKLNTIQSIIVNSESVNLEYKTIAHYSEGVNSKEDANHLNIYSTGGFTVGVKYETISDSYIDGTDKPTGTVRGTAADMFTSINVKVYGVGAEASDVIKPLSTDDTSLFTSASGVVDQSYKVRYEGLGGKSYMNYISEGKVREYEATVTYSIIPS